MTPIGWIGLSLVSSGTAGGVAWIVGWAAGNAKGFAEGIRHQKGVQRYREENPMPHRPGLETPRPGHRHPRTNGHRRPGGWDGGDRGHPPH